VALRNSPQHVFTTIGAWRLGSGVLPLRWDLPPWERDRLLDLAHPDIVVGDWEDLPGTVSTGDLARAASLADGPLPDRIADPAMAVATSGSSGGPKLIISPGSGLFDPDKSAYLTSERVGAGPGQVQLVPAPLYHANGFRICHGGLHRGEQVILMERFDAGRLVELVERYRVSTVTMAPTMLQRVARLPEATRRDLSSLQSVLQGAGPCPEWVARWWIDVVGAERFFMTYGSSEQVGITLIRGDEWLDHPGSVGRGLQTDIRVLDDDGRDVAVGEVGEVFMRRQDAGAPRHEYRGSPPAKPGMGSPVWATSAGWTKRDISSSPIVVST
jgi:bile acid-coenzyme A ligase